MSRLAQPVPAGPHATTRPGRRTGAWSTLVRAVTVMLLLNFDQFPRAFGRAFLLTAAALAVLIVFNEMLRPESRARVVVFWVVVVFGVLALPGVLRRPETDYGQLKLILLVTVTLLATVAVAVIRSQRDIEAFALAVVLCGVVLAVAALASGARDGRAAGFGSNPIWLARAIGLAVVAAIWLYFCRRLSMPRASALVVLLALGLFATGSRGPLVAAVVALFALVLSGFRRKVRRGRREWVGVGLMGALVVVVLALPSLLPPRMYALVVDPSEELAETARAEMRERTMSIIAEHPGGVGYGNWTSHSWMVEHDYPHNLWLELLAEAGWLVGGAFILLCLVTAVRLWGAARSDAVAGFVLAMVAFNAVAVSTSGDVNASRGLFVSLALGLLVLLLRGRRPADTTPTGTGPPRHTGPAAHPRGHRGYARR
ncbi:O-antigen ligase family protein [Micromonospora sp. C31]|uniref:O-antigen ligase family protein n=1 Tax=Micromonospora sp. C31 TaxID=2824876 RepID=UPI001B395C5B|nr:O-antigen ligase family protein [Micromonospora sp. C31]MBQ1075059.1 O-antigen ligase family protein [Micromonospora sp. C31]